MAISFTLKSAENSGVIIIVSIIVLAAPVFALSSGCSFGVSDKANSETGNAEPDKVFDTNILENNKGEDAMADEKFEDKFADLLK